MRVRWLGILFGGLSCAPAAWATGSPLSASDGSQAGVVTLPPTAPWFGATGVPAFAWGPGRAESPPRLDGPGTQAEAFVAADPRGGSDAETASGEAAPSGDASVPRGPFLDPELSRGIRVRLESALPLARQRLRAHRTCRSLFARLGASGFEQLDGASYHPATRKHEGKYCRGNNYAVTVVGRATIGLCRKFRRLSDQEAAIILLHEALHFAGQAEYPADRTAPDALAITEMVETSCRLYR